MQEKLVAIAPFLRSCPQLVTLGVRPSMGDYTPRQRGMLLSASQIFFPTPRFVNVLHAAGKKTFPSAFTYSVQKSRLMQEVLFQFLKCPHPFTRIYYGRQKSSIAEDFSFPLKAMGPKTMGGARLVSNAGDLQALTDIYNPLIIQDMLDYAECFRLIFVNYKCAGIIKRVSSGAQCGFNSHRISPNPQLEQGIGIEFFSREILSCLEKLLRSMQINDIAVEIGTTRRGWRLIELARPPLSWPTPDGVTNRHRLISHLIESNKL
jgi:ribosomal protein S6--L-glutamate ligase